MSGPSSVEVMTIRVSINRIGGSHIMIIMGPYVIRRATTVAYLVYKDVKTSTAVKMWAINIVSGPTNGA